MGWFSTDYLKLDILMHLNITARTGRGAIRWTHLTEHPGISQPQTRIALAALNYGRFLINQKETRADLFQRVNDASERLVQGQKEFSVTHWSMKVAGTELPVWPWCVESPEQITNGKVYVATLQGAKTGTLSVNLKMAWGQELILTPVASLLPLFILSTELDEQNSVTLGKTLLQMNRYWRSPEAASRTGSEAEAFKSAIPVLVT